jgi:hypothetical protein
VPIPTSNRRRAFGVPAAVFLCLLCAPLTLRAQDATPGVATATAARTNDPMVLDGRDGEPVWRVAPISDEFFQFTPAEAGPARFRTAFQVAYDDRTLYVYVRAFDPRPDSLVALLSRRDVRTPSEWIKVVIDGFHDRRNAMQFMVNPAGVKRDASVYSDVNEDIAWDAVWDVAVTVDSLGWAAEFAIPFSQLRFTPKSEHIFGFGIWRDIARHGERDAWPVYRPSHATFASQLGDLVGVTDIGRNRRLEVMPYAVTKNVTEPTPTGFAHPQQQSLGLDIKTGIGSAITLDATVNPDFGQVEADPAVLNLSAFEVRFDERRPFFQEGINLFRCNGPCEGIFYTRRVGRTPQLRTAATDPLFSRIQAAAKLTGRLEGGAQFGLVAVSSAREVGSLGQTIEPQTTTLVGRFLQDFRGGRSQLGTMVTSVLRDLDDDSEDFLRKEAHTVLLQGFHRFAQRWEVSGYTGFSAARGTTAAIRRTQLSSVHFHQRPDHDVEFDSTATSMNGGVSSLSLRRYAGRVRWETTTRYAVPWTELNDLGFVTLINDAMVRNNLSIQALRPASWYRRRSAFVFSENHWTTGGLPTGFILQTGANAEFKNFWTASTNLTASNLGATHCVSCARGGPALRLSSTRRWTASLNGDQRKSIIPGAFVAVSGGDGGRSWSREAELSVSARVGTRTSFDLGANAERRAIDAQWVGNYGATFSDTTHYTFARLDQNILGITTRANVTVSPTVSVQVYAQPFIASGRYSRWREIVDAHAKEYEDRFAPYGTGDPPGFNSKQFNSNVVFRWEYRPGSVLFVVWQQGRADARNPGTFEAGRDLQSLFATNPNNTFLVKLSYWFNP